MIDCLLSMAADGHFSCSWKLVDARGGQNFDSRIKSSGLGGRAKTRGSETRVAESSRKAGAFHHRERGKDHQGGVRTEGSARMRERAR